MVPFTRMTVAAIGLAVLFGPVTTSGQSSIASGPGMQGQTYGWSPA